MILMLFDDLYVNVTSQLQCTFMLARGLSLSSTVLGALFCCDSCVIHRFIFRTNICGVVPNIDMTAC